jgi:hypothetical protein
VVIYSLEHAVRYSLANLIWGPSMKKLMPLVAALDICWVCHPALGADFSGNFTVSAQMTCSVGGQHSTTVRRVGDHIFEGSNSGNVFVVNGTVDVTKSGVSSPSVAKYLKGASGTNSSEVSASSVTLRQSVTTKSGHSESTTRITLSGSSCEYTEDFGGPFSISCHSTRCSVKDK